jgi:hypothetical protein
VHFPSDEIHRLCDPELLDLQLSDIPVYFFTLKVRFNRT